MRVEGKELKNDLELRPNNNNIYYLYINGQEKSFQQVIRPLMNRFLTSYSHIRLK